MKTYDVTYETKYNKNEQRDEYKAIIIDNDGYQVKRGVKWHWSKEDAKFEADELLTSIELDKLLHRYGITSKKHLFIDHKAFSRYIIKSLIIILLPFMITMTFVATTDIIDYRDPLFIFAPFLVFLVSVFIFLLGLKRHTSNLAAFLFKDNELYRIMIGNQNASLANVLNRYVGSAAALSAVLSGNEDRLVLQQLLVRDDIFKSISKQNVCLQILRVNKIKKIYKGYKISCLVEKGINKKRKHKTIYIKEGFNDYQQLIKIFEYIQETRKTSQL